MAGKEIVLFRQLHQVRSAGVALADLSEAYSKTFKSLTVKAETSLIEAVRMKTPNFGMLNAGRGSLDTSKSTISVLLLNLLDYFTAEWNMTQLEDCSEIIATDFYWLSQAKFKIFTLRCKKGHFGTDYGKLSPQRLLLWLEDFSQECRFKRAGITDQVRVGTAQLPAAEPHDVDVAGVFAIMRRQLAQQEADFQSATTQRQSSAIKEAQKRLQWRWNELQQQHNDDSVIDS